MRFSLAHLHEQISNEHWVADDSQSAVRTTSGAADSYPLGIAIIIKRI
jgi:hypothetical protein